MLDDTGLRSARRYGMRLLRAMGPRFGPMGLVALLLSLGALAQPQLLGFFSPAEIARAWGEHLLELLLAGTVLLLAYSAWDEALPRRMPWRLTLSCTLLFALAAVLTLLLHAYYAGGFAHLPPPLRLLADALRWGLPAVFLVLVANVQRRAWQAHSAAEAADAARARSLRAAGEQRLAALQAQVEPHFLFNALGHVRRLYRTQPQRGADAIASLMRYLRAALPRMRSARGSLGDELELARAYLDLLQLRMGRRLAVAFDADPGLHAAEFPPMLLMTLVENAIRHGLEPAGGGMLQVRARAHPGRPGRLEVMVLDDGVGFAAAPAGGTGVGLANVRRQLAALYPGQGRLLLQARQPRGAVATITIPWHALPA